MILSGGGINWCWYLEMEIDGKFANVKREWRLHNFDEMQGSRDHPKKVDGDYSIREREGKRELGEHFAPRFMLGVEVHKRNRSGKIEMKYYPLREKAERFHYCK